MRNEGKFIIYVNPTHYWELELLPVLNEYDEKINRCTLINSETAQAIEAIAFNAEYIIPIFQSKSQIGLKDVAITLKEITDKHGILTMPREQMPQDKRIKETQKLVKRIVK
jgi:hypothetical protein